MANEKRLIDANALEKHKFYYRFQNFHKDMDLLQLKVETVQEKPYVALLYLKLLFLIQEAPVRIVKQNF